MFQLVEEVIREMSNADPWDVQAALIRALSDAIQMVFNDYKREKGAMDPNAKVASSGCNADVHKESVTTTTSWLSTTSGARTVTSFMYFLYSLDQHSKISHMTV